MHRDFRLGWDGSLFRSRCFLLVFWKWRADALSAVRATAGGERLLVERGCHKFRDSQAIITGWGWLACSQTGKQLDVISSSHRMGSGAVIIVGIENHHFDIQIRMAKP